MTNRKAAKPIRDHVTIWMTPAEKRALRIYAAKENSTVGAIVRKLIAEHAKP